MADADLELAAKDAVAYSLDNTGQVCCSIERIYVAEAIYDEFAKRVAELAAEYKVGNGLNPDVNVGPLVSAMQKAHVQGHVKDAVDNGASVIFQGKIPEDAPEAANFFPVTVVSEVKEGMKMYREETFGPVVSLTKFDGSEESAVRLANDTNYGLAAAVYSKDLAKAQRVASKIQAGQVGINCYSLDHMDYRCPWVGHKDSGLGYHSGIEGFHNFSIPQSLVFKP
jgi:acyl-CoA reductase-like NAD-dependent aldehyde dehydrogenase